MSLFRFPQKLILRQILKWRWFYLEVGVEGNTKIPVKEGREGNQQRMCYPTSYHCGRLERVYPTGVLGNSTRYKRGEVKKAGVILPSPISPLPSGSRGTFQRLQRKLLGTVQNLRVKRKLGRIDMLRPEGWRWMSSASATFHLPNLLVFCWGFFFWGKIGIWHYISFRFKML